MFIAAVKQVNRVIVDAQEEVAVRVVHRFTSKDESVERLIRFQMDAVREFAERHPLQSWNPLFLLVPGLGQELMDDIATARAQFFRMQSEIAAKEEQAVIEATIARKKTDLDAVRERILDLRKQGRIRDVPAGDYTVDEFFKRATRTNVKPTITKTPL